VTYLSVAVGESDEGVGSSASGVEDAGLLAVDEGLRERPSERRRRVKGKVSNGEAGGEVR
jgi:hypothetical protein